MSKYKGYASATLTTDFHSGEACTVPYTGYTRPELLRQIKQLRTEAAEKITVIYWDHQGVHMAEIVASTSEAEILSVIDKVMAAPETLVDLLVYKIKTAHKIRVGLFDCNPCDYDIAMNEAGHLDSIEFKTPNGPVNLPIEAINQGCFCRGGATFKVTDDKGEKQKISFFVYRPMTN